MTLSLTIAGTLFFATAGVFGVCVIAECVRGFRVFLASRLAGEER